MEQHALDLTKSEIEILCDRMSAPGRAFSSQLMEEVEPEDPATIKVSITWTR